jgi:hypothetical protein
MGWDQPCLASSPSNCPHSVNRPVGFRCVEVLARTGVVAIPWQPSAVRVGRWVTFSILALNTVANFASRSRIERTVMTSAAFVCSVCLLVAALSDCPKGSHVDSDSIFGLRVGSVVRGERRRILVTAKPTVTTDGLGSKRF